MQRIHYFIYLPLVVVALLFAIMGMLWLTGLLGVLIWFINLTFSKSKRIVAFRQKSIIVYTLLFLGVFVFAIIFKTLMLSVYKIPSGSMERTIKTGDVVWVNKFVYGPKMPKNPYEVPWLNVLYWAFHRGDTTHVMPQWPYWRLKGLGIMQRGDVIVFEHPDNNDIFIKRCVALPGDTLQVVHSKTIVNQKLLPSPPMALYCAHPVLDTTCAVFPYQQNLNWSIDDYGPIIIPEKGMTVLLNSFSFALYRSIIKRYEGVDLLVKNNLYYLNGELVEDYKFENDYCFAMGDNRHDSNDSRYFGFVPMKNVVGKASCIIYSPIGNMNFFNKLVFSKL